jgi:hypothetical protein
MHSELYTDGVGEVTIGGSIVRVDLFSLSPTERDANDAPKKIFRQRLIFSAESFANSVEVMQTALQGLADAGVIQRNQPRVPSAALQAAARVERASSVSDSSRSQNVSTNFR